MENPKAEQPETPPLASSGETRIAAARRTIAESPNAIESECRRTKNSWPECFGSRVFPIETYLDNDKVRAELGDEKYAAVMAKIEELKTKLDDLKSRYPDKETPPPEEVKKQFLQLLNVLT